MPTSMMRSPVLSLALTGLLFAAVLPDAGAGEKLKPARKVTFVVVDDDAKSDPGRTLYLRPNQLHTMSVSLQNDEDRDLKKGEVKLVRLGGPEPEVLLRAEVASLSAKSKEKLKFEKSKPNAPKDIPADKEKPKPDADAAFNLKGPRHALQLWLEVPGHETAKKDLTVLLQHPRDYIDAKGKYDPESEELTFDVTLRPSVTGPQAAKADVVLDYVAELRQKPDGVLSRSLEEPGKAYKLVVKQLKFNSDADAASKRPIFLRIDGFERAFEFWPSLQGGGIVPERPDQQKTAVRFRTPPYSLPTDRLEISLEIDGQIDQSTWVHCGWDPTGAGDQFSDQKRLGLRNIRVRVGDGPKGQLVLETKVSDWKIGFTTQGAQGKGLIRVGVFPDEDGKGEALPLDPTALAPFRIAGGAGFSRLEIPKQDDRYIQAPVIIDGTLPTGISFKLLGDEKKRWAMNSPIPVQASASPRLSLAPITKVVFFPGEPAKDGKLPEKVFPGEQQKGIWTAKLPPFEKKGTQQVTVVFETATGKSAYKSEDIEIYEPKTTGGAEESGATATIKGAVFQFLAIKDNRLGEVEVLLIDRKLLAKTKKAEDAQKDSTKSNAKGDFMFEDVPPGDYKIMAQTKIRGEVLVGSVDVEVTKKGEVKDPNAKVVLKYAPKKSK